MVRAKFKVASNKQMAEDQHDIVLQPVTSGSEENEDFFKYTPAGLIELKIVHGDAAATFEEGVEYYVDFTKA